MRGYLQQVGGQLVAKCRQWGLGADRLVGWLLGIGATAVYMLTLEPTASFWDCGEFVAVSHRLQVGHPPGAPFYQLLAHLFTLMAGGDAGAVAWWSNALSAVAGGGTVMMLYWSVRLLMTLDVGEEGPGRAAWRSRMAAVAGSLCYLFCDTAWFSAVESEVYSLAMLIAASSVWAMLRWYRCASRVEAQRWLMLLALLMGLGVCTHLLTLLTLPALLPLIISKAKEGRLDHKRAGAKHSFLLGVFLVVFFLIGLSPYLLIPIRAAANPPINEGHPSTAEDFKHYLLRDQYEKAPLYPRMWRHREHDAEYAASWCGGDTTLVGNVRYYFSYQLTYMYLRYLMWNFSGRYNDRQGFGSPQNGQFVTGIPPIDRLLVGTSAKMPCSLPSRGHNVYYMLPLLLGIAGVVALARRRKAFWVATILFLMGGVVLNLYLNHPCYEPRERDYAYILSFYAFGMYIAFGAKWLLDKAKKYQATAKKSSVGYLLVLGIYLLVFAVPLLMACQNWDDHDRSHRYVARDAAANMLGSCDSDERGTVLFTYGDNDTFPLWYVQQVEGVRPDVRVENIGLMGTHNFVDLLSESMEQGRPVYFTHYAYNQYRHLFPHRMQLEGNTYRLTTDLCDSVALEPFYRHAMQQMGWHRLEGVYIDETCCKFIEQYWRDILLLAEGLNAQGMTERADSVLNKTIGELPPHILQDPTLIYRIAQAFAGANQKEQAEQMLCQLKQMLDEQLRYYHTLPTSLQAYLVYTLAPREELAAQLAVGGQPF